MDIMNKKEQEDVEKEGKGEMEGLKIMETNAIQEVNKVDKSKVGVKREVANGKRTERGEGAREKEE